MIDQQNSVEYTDKLVKLYSKLSNDKKYEFAGIGRFAQNDPNRADIDPMVLLPVGIFAIVGRGTLVMR